MVSGYRSKKTGAKNQDFELNIQKSVCAQLHKFTGHSENDKSNSAVETRFDGNNSYRNGESGGRNKKATWHVICSLLVLKRMEQTKLPPYPSPSILIPLKQSQDGLKFSLELL
ncbi:uncharacterized protein A4U43_C05F7640 [Asparagus officinalis]|uniref:Uncharacterized protein n=1 Tax=Asparagus officinalis TaxID=4686 RepID=A0A5P1ETR7_ASPOF|nr:uncharacterized protein A4U43_C05F7640 [Asparagus officinalis]